MDEIKHTPGPWIATRCDDGTMMVHTEGDIVAGIVAFGDRGALDEANARLIATAPDLLEALKAAREMLERYEHAATGETFNDLQINAAIAKAEGQS